MTTDKSPFTFGCTTSMPEDLYGPLIRSFNDMKNVEADLVMMRAIMVAKASVAMATAKETRAAQ